MENIPMNDQATVLVTDLAKHVVRYMRTEFPTWRDVYVRFDAPTDSQCGVRVSYVDGDAVSIVDVMQHRPLIAEIMRGARQLRDVLTNDGRKFCVALLRANSKLDYQIDFEWKDIRKWEITKMRGGTGLPVGLEALSPLRGSSDTEA